MAPLVTFDGHIGAGGPEVGRRIARMFDLQYVDRLLLPESIRLMQVADHSQRPASNRFSDRFWGVVERAISGFALGNAAGDPYFGLPATLLLPLTWDESPTAPRAILDTSTSTARQRRHALTPEHIATSGRTVLVDRAGCVELKRAPTVVRVGLFASWEDRVKRVMAREGLVRIDDAERAILGREKAQAAYFDAIHGMSPEDPGLYDLHIDTSKLDLNIVALNVARAVRAMISSNQDPAVGRIAV